MKLGVSDLLDANGHRGKTGLLPVVTLQFDAMFLVDDSVGSYWRMVADLFRDEFCFSDFLVRPVAKEEFTEERV